MRNLRKVKGLGNTRPNYLTQDFREGLHELSADERRVFVAADVGVSGHGHLQEPGGIAVKSLPVSAPLLMQLPAIEFQEIPYLEILDRERRRVVTVIEVLSPSNKQSGGDGDQYSGKRKLTMAARTNLVEIDLLRGGNRVAPPTLPNCDYCVSISAVRDWPTLAVWPIMLRDRLPTIPIPLAGSDADVEVDLQAIFQRTYDAVGYASYIYENTPEPALAPADAIWAKELLNQSGHLVA